jgi:hypothetical protein
MTAERPATAGDRPAAPGPSDTEALRALSTAYAAAVDARDGEAFAALFTDSGELVVPDGPGAGDPQPTVHRAGRDELRLVPEGLRPYARTFHLLSDHSFSFSGDRATGDVRGVAHHVTAATRGKRARDRAGTDTVWFVRYRDDYVRTPEGWRFERRVLHLQWVEEHVVTVLPADEHGGHPAPRG